MLERLAEAHLPHLDVAYHLYATQGSNPRLADPRQVLLLTRVRLALDRLRAVQRLAKGIGAAQTRLDDPPSSRPACDQAGLLLTRVRLALDRRLVVAAPLAYLYPRLHHANVALRTAYLDREVT